MHHEGHEEEKQEKVKGGKVPPFCTLPHPEERKGPKRDFLPQRTGKGLAKITEKD
jgi:hypothetical protein